MGPFDIDNQTLNDLEIFESASNEKSIFSFFDFTSTIGGKEKLRSLFNHPQTDIQIIEERKSLIGYLMKCDKTIAFNKESLDFIEYYLRQNDKPRQAATLDIIGVTTRFFLKNNQEQYLRQRGAQEVLELIHLLYDFCSELIIDVAPKLLQTLNERVHGIINRQADIKRHNQLRPKTFKLFELEKYDFLIRNSEVLEIKELLEICYSLDAYLSVAKSAKTYNLSFPLFIKSNDRSIEIKGVFHLFVKHPVPNDIYFNTDKNICFITGVNMAGKSTLLKSVAISIYLAHLGFPVPAESMETSIFDGLITTINLSDNLNQGYSHFYNEVLRVKHVAQKVTASKNMMVIFDELFRGTNVKDAYDASLSIITAFSQIRNSFFIISTHIVEVAKELNKNNNINFCFLETSMVDGKPMFTHKLKEGITDERMGMWIIENEGIMEILNGKSIS
ncbi:hypothetical protein [Pedobacter foliorum]|uniref:MutS-related protein n=1 Tax=Pedobacter foliorum TaxID=2739058 RepID=UPI001567578B|nr:hypothetical protein [Pedobacter foliorum]NRF37905.1 hypothetical protein [Pedobacter foliorum]